MPDTAAPSVTAAPPKAAALPPIGITGANTAVFASFQPTVASLAWSLTPVLQSAVGLGKALPLPTGLQLQRSPDDKQTQLVAARSLRVK